MQKEYISKESIKQLAEHQYQIYKGIDDGTVGGGKLVNAISTFGDSLLHLPSVKIDEKKEPPLGLKPEKVFEYQCNSERVVAIIEAMKRYAEAEEPIPLEWVTELEKRIL